MKKVFYFLFLCMFFVLTGCAGMNSEYQRNMVTNASLWGAIGAATGAGIAAATGGNPGKAAILGGIAGAYLGAGNTPPPRSSTSGEEKILGGDCSRFQSAGERAACERGRAARESRIQRARERRAYEYGRGW